MKLKKGDTVKVLIGKDKGRQSTVEKIYPTTGKILVTGINQFKRHIKGKAQGAKSEIATITKSIWAANVALMCPNCKKPTRIGYIIDDNRKVRICKKCDKKI